MQLFWLKQRRNSEVARSPIRGSRKSDESHISTTTGQTSIVRFMRSVDTRRQNNITSQTRQQAARGAALHTSSNTVDGDQLSEEPRTKIAMITLFPFLRYIQDLILTFLP